MSLAAMLATPGSALADPGPSDDAPPEPLAHPSAIPTAAVPDFATLSSGDHAWWAGDRATAVRSWHAALATADASPRGRALEAMLRVRLLQVSGNLGPFVHEVALDRALAACPDSEPWCRIAEADRELFLPAFTGADPANVPGLLASLPPDTPADVRAAAAGRLAMATHTAPEGPLDGFGEGLRASGTARPPDPGTWVLGIGVGGARGAGISGVVRFVHPDVAWRAHRLEVSATGDTRGGAGLIASFSASGSPAPVASVVTTRAVGDRWEEDVPHRYTLGVARVAAGAGVRRDGVSTSLVAVGRVERLGDRDPAWLAGPAASFTLASSSSSLRFSGEMDLGSYTWVGLGLDARATAALGRATLAGRALVSGVPTPDVPFYRLPTAGGTELLRGLPAGRFRAPVLLGVQAELRHPIVGPLHAALFTDLAAIDGVHATAGAGLRLVLPPGRDNVTRLDVGFGPEGWGVVAAWGDAF